MRTFLRGCIWMLLVASLTACGYRTDCGPLGYGLKIVSVPFIEGDFDGSMTAALVYELGKSGCYEYASCGGDLTLKVVLLDYGEENIGFRYDRKKRGKLRRSIIPTETRLKVQAEVSLLESASGRVCLGPAIISASVDYDHDYYSSRHAVNIFSLGQLSDVDAARDAAQHPLNLALSKKIVDYVCDSW